MPIIGKISSSPSPMEISSPPPITTDPTPSPSSISSSPKSFTKTLVPFPPSDQDSSNTPSLDSSPSIMKSFTNTSPIATEQKTIPSPSPSKASIITAAIRRSTDTNLKRQTHCFDKFDLSLPVPFPVYITKDIPRIKFRPHVFHPVPPPELRPVLPPVPLMKKLQHLQTMQFYWKDGKVVKSAELLPTDTLIVYKIVMDKRVTSFTVNNGPRRSLDHVPNLVFLDSIRNRICPKELEPKDKDVCYFSYVKSRAY